MKNISKILIAIIISVTAFLGCQLEETPPFLAPENVFTTEEGANTALNGAYSTFTDHFLYGADFHHITNFTSGFFTSGITADRSNIAAMNPQASKKYVNNFWKQSYKAISRANDVIGNIEVSENDGMNNILGQAYFLRAHLYFNLVRMYGEIPIRTKLVTTETIHVAKSPISDVYDLIIADAIKAKSLLATKDVQTVGRPSDLAANMILAKVYMTLAGNDNASDYWQKAYDEAIVMHGQYSLVDSYAELWDTESTANNNSESIFEIQFSEEAPSKLGRLFTPSTAFAGKGWQRIKANPETIDMHMTKYPGDPRINLTYVTKYVHYDKGTDVKTHPEVSRTNFGKGFPFLYKFFMKDREALIDATNFNYVHFRYADLLLMLAEIENELGQTATATTRVNEVLSRARNTGGTVEPADWTVLSQDDFRTAVMREYQYELIGEGQDWFNNRRRGYDYFKTNIIEVHNARNEKNFDIVYPDNDRIMLMPIPSDEINSNQLIGPSDQNPGY